MSNTKVITTIPAPIEKIWALVGNFGDLPYLSDLIKQTTLEGEGAGSVRTLELAAGGLIKERLDVYSAAEHHYTYTIINDDTCPLPFQNYSASVALRALDANSTELSWGGTFEPKPGASEADAIGAANSVYTGAIAGILASLT